MEGGRIKTRKMDCQGTSLIQNDGSKNGGLSVSKYASQKQIKKAYNKLKKKKKLTKKVKIEMMLIKFNNTVDIGVIKGYINYKLNNT